MVAPLMDTTNVTLLDRSRAVVDWKCPRMRFWQYEHLGRGIVSDTVSLELALGTATHNALAEIAIKHRDNGGLVDIDTIATTTHNDVFKALMEASAGEDEGEALNYANEQATLIEGLLRGFYKHVWPRLIQQYPIIVAVEHEMTYQLGDNIIFMSKPDLVLADQEDNWWLVEYKTTSSKSEGWIKGWSTAVQVHSSIRAVEQTLGKAPVGVLIQGLYKGFESYGKQSSPFCYGYHRPANPPFIKEETLYQYRAGFKRFPTWEMEGGVKRWIEGMPPDILGDQFPQPPMIFVKDDLVDAFFSQVEVRQKEINLANQMLEAYGDDPVVVENILNTSFRQHFDSCSSYYGRDCEFKRICFGGVTEPLAQGYQLREAHHQLEMEKFNAKVQEASEVSSEA